jgi:hypothetical protein
VTAHGYVFDYGGGFDYRLFRFIGLRAEVRDFFSENLNVNTPLSSSNQHDVVASGGSISALLNPPRTTPDKQAEATAQCQALISDE